MKISNLIIANNQIFLFSLEGYLLSFDYKSGKIQSVEKILENPEELSLLENNALKIAKENSTEHITEHINKIINA